MPRPQDSGPVERSILYWIRLYIARFFCTTNSQIRRLSSLRSRRLEVTGARKQERTGRARETREGSGSTPSRVSLAFFLAPIFSKRLLQRLANPTQKYQKKKTHTLCIWRAFTKIFRFGERIDWGQKYASWFVFTGQCYLVCVVFLSVKFFPHIQNTKMYCCKLF